MNIDTQTIKSDTQKAKFDTQTIKSDTQKARFDTQKQRSWVRGVELAYYIYRYMLR